MEFNCALFSSQLLPSPANCELLAVNQFLEFRMEIGANEPDVNRKHLFLSKNASQFYAKVSNPAQGGLLRFQ
jgi:hypothetical protein